MGLPYRELSRSSDALCYLETARIRRTITASSRAWERRQVNTFIFRTVPAACFALFTAVAYAQSQTLTGQVSSAEEGAMEGVVVSAKKDGSTISVSVVTDARGRFTFPA